MIVVTEDHATLRELDIDNSDAPHGDGPRDDVDLSSLSWDAIRALLTGDLTIVHRAQAASQSMPSSVSRVRICEFTQKSDTMRARTTSPVQSSNAAQKHAIIQRGNTNGPLSLTLTLCAHAIGTYNDIRAVSGVTKQYHNARRVKKQKEVRRGTREDVRADGDAKDYELLSEYQNMYLKGDCRVPRSTFARVFNLRSRLPWHTEVFRAAKARLASQPPPLER